jgi:hypothetical protein
MKSEHFVYIALVTLAIMNAGCAGIEGRIPRFMLFSEQERHLAGARDLLRAGKEQQARNLLEKVAAGNPVNGVTDEALFRLALLSLNEDGGRGLLRAQTLLERLADNYPGSLWTKQSAPLLSHLVEARNLRNRQRELKNLKEHNLSLSRDNRELRQSLEQLKQLDLELERRIKR